MSHSWYKHYTPKMKKEIDIDSLRSIAASLEEACRRGGDRIALTCMGVDMSFRRLDEQATHFASYLQNVAGLQKGERLAIMLPNIIQFPVVFLAAQKIGAVCVNTNPLYTPREMRHQFKDSGAKALVIVDMFLDKLEQVIKDTDIQTVVATSLTDFMPSWKAMPLKTILSLKGMIPKHGLSVTPYLKALEQGRTRPLKAVSIHHDDIAILQYTGGTTGIAKGAMLTQRNILANMAQIENCAHGYLEDGREAVLTALPLYHIFALTVNFLSFLMLGQRMVLLPKPVPIKNTVKIFKKYPISVMTGVNTLFNALNNDPEFRKLAPRTIKFALAGGMALQESVAKEWKAITGNTIVQGFGLTESSPVTHVNPMDTGGIPGSIGIPVASTEAKVVDELGNEVPIGSDGELIVRGPQIMAGYWNRPDETAKALKDGWLWTGDIARRDESGYFYIVDRKKDMILVSGFNVYPNEVEEVLASHNKVAEVAVIGVPDKKAGEVVKAYVVPKDETVTSEELLKFCKEHLTAYKRPKTVEFRKELPKSNIGKILRKELRAEMIKEMPPLQ